MAVNPEILAWARDTAGLTVDQAARALAFQNTRDRSAVQRLMALEAGEEQPSRSVLLRMSKAYRRALLVFYLAQPPRIGDRGEDFRTVPGGTPPEYSPLLDALIRDIRGRQTAVRGLMEETDPQPVDFIGTATMNVPVGNLANRITERLQFSLDEFRRQADVQRAFSYLREKVEATGVYVLLLGNLGSHHTNISVDAFRGFAIADPNAPFIVINDQDAQAAWSFTMLHEIVHLWLGTTGISSTSTEARIEKYCNDVAGEILLPTSEIRGFADLRRATLDDLMEVISRFASSRNISRAMVAYKLLRTDAITDRTWRQVSDRLREEWLEIRRTQEQEERAGTAGGPSYYVVKRHRLGNALLDIIRRSLSEGIITPTKAAQVLGVKARNVDPLIHGTLPEGGR
jgi:Zn-dependent peptidase ImmA (M78 family)